MDLDLSSDQELLRETTERFIESTFPLSRVRQLVDEGTPPPADYTRQAGELGWFAFLASEDAGGGSVSGQGVLDAVILAEERGKALQPGAFIDTNVVVAALAAEGSEEQRAKILPTLISGEAAAAWALVDPTGDLSGTAGLEVAADAGGFRLTGSRGLVLEAQTAAWLLVTAAGPDGPTQFLLATDTPGVSVEVLAGLDLTRKLAEVRFDGVRVEPSSLVGAPGQAGPAVERQVDLASVLLVAESVGAMDHLFGITLEYAKDRTAFGRPIGSFQAVKHQLADSSLLLEMSKAAAVGAAHAVQAAVSGGPAARGTEAASIAKAFVADAGIQLAHACWQNFGGIGYTWEHDLHLYLRRLTTDASLYGPPAYHRERICRANGL